MRTLLFFNSQSPTESLWLVGVFDIINLLRQEGFRFWVWSPASKLSKAECLGRFRVCTIQKEFVQLSSTLLQQL